MTPPPPPGFFPRQRALYGLKRGKLRQSWHKNNLYNITRYRSPVFERLGIFKQKWQAKSDSRAYHGNQVREKKWQRMFQRRINAVVSMNAVEMAKNDGTLQSAGRGSGLEEKPNVREDDTFEDQRQRRTPFMQMVYAPFERRLDSAIHRALFASSIRQARQFVIHGAVKVNGKKMQYSGYLLNPGDMFQVDPDLVQYAAGAKKLTTTERRAGRKAKLEEEQLKLSPKKTSSNTPSKEGADSKPDPMLARASKNLLELARELGPDHPPVLTPAQRSTSRQFQQSLRQLLSQSKADPSTLSTVDGQLAELTSQLSIHAPSLISQSTELAKDPERQKKLLAEDRDTLKAALEQARQNPVDDTKSYATPWRPRDYLSAFAFIPRFLEVNQKVCSAVYLRHPVARPGFIEVPSPFAFDTHQLAFTWYLKRR